MIWPSDLKPRIIEKELNKLDLLEIEIELENFLLVMEVLNMEIIDTLIIIGFLLDIF